MIDFAKITKTLTGLACCYIGQRTSGGQVLHRFAVFSDVGEVFCYYNEQGQKIEFSGAGGWLVDTKGHQIIAPPKIVEFTRFAGLYTDDNLEYFVNTARCKENLQSTNLLAIKEHTFRFEVPND